MAFPHVSLQTQPWPHGPGGSGEWTVPVGTDRPGTNRPQPRVPVGDKPQRAEGCFILRRPQEGLRTSLRAEACSGEQAALQVSAERPQGEGPRRQGPRPWRAEGRQSAQGLRLAGGGGGQGLAGTGRSPGGPRTYGEHHGSPWRMLSQGDRADSWAAGRPGLWVENWAPWARCRARDYSQRRDNEVDGEEGLAERGRPAGAGTGWSSGGTPRTAPESRTRSAAVLGGAGGLGAASSR